MLGPGYEIGWNGYKNADGSMPTSGGNMQGYHDW
jgi:hypothetical protein